MTQEPPKITSNWIFWLVLLTAISVNAVAMLLQD
jgi:hypothetical protein